ncbi:unknown protein [Desulfotalea psychrophila LSv54]|uniref:Uncharacterized protein n=1 Tax=Desulfotalea psychrophila (strain LSv54 / DSM 12343) TaxID=177439 RepID=Q6AK36_DESPS|nr:unknown protein [Desulfotalea psychrophila LSv54]
MAIKTSSEILAICKANKKIRNACQMAHSKEIAGLTEQYTQSLPARIDKDKKQYAHSIAGYIQ